MKRLWNVSMVLVAFFVVLLPLAQRQVPEHFYNPLENINPDPYYAPGDFPLAEIYEAKVMYYVKKTELGEVAVTVGSAVTTGMGEITFLSVKNEDETVLGYFRNYFGALTVGDGGPESMDMVIDVNSLDTGVPGRNNRILNIFFESMKPDLGTAIITFDGFDLGGKTLGDWAEGKTSAIQASGTITLNGVRQAITAILYVTKQGGTWMVETAEPIGLLISDFAFGDQPYELMKSCNHKALGNAVEVEVKLYLR